MNVSRICVTFFDISWNAFNRTTCGNVAYYVSVFPLPIEQSMENITRVGDTFYFSVTGLNNSDPNVTITVTASNKAGQRNMSIPVRLPESLGKYYIHITTGNTYIYIVYTYTCVHMYMYIIECTCVHASLNSTLNST